MTAFTAHDDEFHNLLLEGENQMAIQDLSDEELRSRLSKRLSSLERGYQEAARRLASRGNGNDAYMKLAVRAEKMYHSLAALHSDATLLESDLCDLMSEPMDIVLFSDR